ncbi:MAG TPA: ABC transporter permease [Pirellulaceae bacterium]|nr:ABC transporter permease [Pirellulaceae bacterium]
MTTIAHHAWASVRFYWRGQLGLALAVATVTATLVGALVVGSSMRGSLKEMTLQRLQRIDEVWLAEHFFSRDFQRQLERLPEFTNHYRQAEPAIWFSTSAVERADGNLVARAAGVTVLGIEQTFWKLARQDSFSAQSLDGDQVLVNRALAEELSITEDAIQAGRVSLTIRVPKPSLLPSDSSLGKKRDLLENLVRLPVVGIVPDNAMGKLSLHPSTQQPRIVYLNLSFLQNELTQSSLKHWAGRDPINAMFLAGLDPARIPEEQVGQRVMDSLRPSLMDLGLGLKQVAMNYREESRLNTAFEYWNLTTERLVFGSELAGEIQARLSDARPVFTYLANTIRLVEPRAGFAESIPYSMVAGIDIDSAIPLESAAFDNLVAPIPEDAVVLNAWAANDLGAEPGDRVEVSYYLPESSHGRLEEASIVLQVADIADLVEPVEPYQYRRQTGLTPAVFDRRPTWANDPDLTPEVPGLTDAESMDRWDLPFTTSERIRPADDDYWNNHRTTPKGFVSLTTARQLWSSRFGDTTGFRIPKEVEADEIQNVMMGIWREHPEWFGLRWMRIKAQGLAASSGATPFDGLFLGLSSFVMVAALILLALLFRLSLEQRSEQLGLLLAVGFRGGRLLNWYVLEGTIVAFVGGLLGIGLGLGYAAGVVTLLTSWWSGAVGNTFLQVFIDWTSVAIGFAVGVGVSLITIAWAIQRARNRPARELLSGNWDAKPSLASGRRWRSMSMMIVMALAACALAISASRMRGESQAGAFLGAGFLVLAAAMIAVRRHLVSLRRQSPSLSTLQMGGLALSNTRRHPMRSTMSIGLTAVAAFLIVALSAFRLRPADESTGGIDWLAETVQPLFEDLNTSEGQIETLGREHPLPASTRVYAWRYKPGEDASCTNPYQSSQPRVLGATEQWIRRYDDDRSVRFHWAGHLSTTEAEKRNPWRLLTGSPGSAIHVEGNGRSEAESIPCIIDKNTAVYSLKIYTLGQVFAIQFDSGQRLYFRLVGMLENSILQGSVLISESAFVRAFPEVSGYRWLLIDSAEDGDLAVSVMRDRLSDYGITARRSVDLLRELMAVQNTYLSAFQTLGALGLLLGTFGLAAIQWRNVIERRRELALMRAVGFSPARMVAVLVLEQVVLLGWGLSIGILSAIITVLPHWWLGGATVPWGQLGVIFLIIIAIGLVVGVWSARKVMRLDLIPSLRMG